MASLFSRKPVTDLLSDEETPDSLKRSLGSTDLIMLAIGAVIGAGIFGAIGSAAAGEINAAGEVVRYGAGPALVLSFVLLGVVCGLAALCYAEIASMIPKAGSAYTYAYATLGELIAWIIGWDLILEYAVGNIAVAISWSGYFTSMLSGFGIDLPVWLTHGYRAAYISSNPEISGLLETAPRIFGIPVILNLPAFAIVAAITWLLMLGVRESARANTIMVILKLLVLGLFIAVGIANINPENYKPFAPNGFTGIHQGAAIVFFAYIGFDAVSTAAEETKDPQRNVPRGILGGLAICTFIYVLVGAVATGLVPYTELSGSDPIARALSIAGFNTISWIVSMGAVISMTAVLLVFQYGQPRIFLAMARDGLLPKWAAKVHPTRRIPHYTTFATGVFVALGALVAEENEIYDLTNIGTLFAFAIVCIGVLVLRYKEPDRHRPFRVPFVWPVGVLGAAACVFVMKGLPTHAWERFGLWLGLGLLIYIAYGYRNSVLRRKSGPPSA